MLSDFLQPHGLQHTRVSCPSLSSRVCSSSGPLSWWCHSTISSSVSPFSSCPHSYPESESFLMSRLFTSSDQRLGASALASVLPMNIQDWFPLDWLVGSPCSPRDSQESSPIPQFKTINFMCVCVCTQTQSYHEAIQWSSWHSYLHQAQERAWTINKV